MIPVTLARIGSSVSMDHSGQADISNQQLHTATTSTSTTSTNILPWTRRSLRHTPLRHNSPLSGHGRPPNRRNGSPAPTHPPECLDHSQTRKDLSCSYTMSSQPARYRHYTDWEAHHSCARRSKQSGRSHRHRLRSNGFPRTIYRESPGTSRKHSRHSV